MHIPLPSRTFAVACCALLGVAPLAQATVNHTYRRGEYATVAAGRSPDGHYAIAAHGDGDFGYENFHLYLMDAKTGKKIGPLEEIKLVLDTGADAYHAKWTPDSSEVSITYREDRHKAVMIRYRVRNGRASRLGGPSEVDGLPAH